MFALLIHLIAPGFFYVGTSADNKVLARSLALNSDSNSTYPTPASASSDLDATVIDAGCEVSLSTE